MNLSPVDIARCQWVAARAQARKPYNLSWGVFQIVKRVSKQTGVSVDVILSGERTGAACYARDLACHIAREHKFTYQQIADTMRRSTKAIENAVAREKARRGG